jgi:hypothetical protein
MACWPMSLYRHRRIGIVARAAVSAILLVGLPPLGVWLAGRALSPYLEFPPLTRYVEHAGFSWPGFVLLAGINLGMLGPAVFAVLRSARSTAPPHPVRSFPWWGWGGLLLTGAAWVLAWSRFETFQPLQPFTFGPLWLGYILVINALTYRRTGRCMMLDRPRFFLLLFPLSAVLWWFFEYLNRFEIYFLTTAAHETAQARLAVTERHQMLDARRLWADLLSSMPLCFNLFGDLAVDAQLADRAVRMWWPDVPGRVSEVRFEHSPGRLDPAYLGNLSAFDAAVMLDLGDGTTGILGVETKYHEVVKRELPKPQRLARYLEITARSGVFTAAAVDAVNGTDLLQLWLDHLLVLSMLQHPGGRWRWGRFVVVYPADNTNIGQACSRYRALRTADRTIAAVALHKFHDR